MGFQESKNRHVWQDHFWARAYKRLPSLFRDWTSIAASFKLFSKPFANHLLFQSTRYLEQLRAVFLKCCLLHDASTDCIDVSMRVGLRTILPFGTEIALTLVAWKWTLGGHPFLRHACPFLDSRAKEKQLRRSSKMGFQESKNRHVWQDHFWARAYKRLPSLFRDWTSIAASFKLFSKPFANHLLFQSTRYLEQLRAVFLKCCLLHDASTDCIDVSMRVGLRTILPFGTEIALTLVAWKWTLGGHPFLRHACPFLDSLAKEKQLRRSSKMGFQESKNRHVWQDHFWARAYKRLPSLFRDWTSIAASFKLFSKPFANHLLFQSTRYLEQLRAVFLKCCLLHDASTDCIDVSMRVGLRTILPFGTEIALTLVAWKWTLGGHPFLRHACPFLDSRAKEKQLRRSSKMGFQESKNRHVWQDHFWAHAYKRLPSLFRDWTSIAASFKLFSKPFANHLLFQSTRYLEQLRAVFLKCCLLHDASTDCIDVSMRVGLRTILPFGTEIALTLVAWKWTLGGHPFLRHACPFLDSRAKEKQLRRSSKMGFQESKNRHVWQDHFWARAYKRLPSLFRDWTSIAASFKLFSKPFANHLLFQSTRYLEQLRAVFLKCCLLHDASTDCIDVSMRVVLRTILPFGTEIALTLVAWKWTLGGHPFLRHACPFLDSLAKEKQLRRSSKMGFQESKNRHVWQDHFWARAYKRLPSLFRDWTSIAASFKLFSKPFANHLLFQSTRYLELWRSFHRSLYWSCFSGPFLGTREGCDG